MKGFVSVMIIALVSVFVAFPASAQNTDCSMYTAKAGDVKNDDNSAENRENLKSFVLNAKCALEKVDTVNSLLKLVNGNFRNLGDWRTTDIGGIYLFIFEKPTEEGAIVLFNANNPEFEGYDLSVVDASGNDVAELLNDNLDNFSIYTWDDPRFEGDEVKEEGKAPGTTPKVSYATAVELSGTLSTVFIIGSGFYLNPMPDTTEESDDGGCAIARGTVNAHGSTSSTLNLFLIVSALFLAVSWKSHTDGR